MMLTLRSFLMLIAGPQVTVAWQGGEPDAQGTDFFKRLCYAKTACSEGLKVLNTFQTKVKFRWMRNGAAFFETTIFLALFCLMVLKRFHDRGAIKHKDGRGSFVDVMQALRFRKEQRNLITLARSMRRT